MTHIETERLILRQFTEKDAGALFSLLSDKEVNTFQPMFPLRDIKEAEAYLRNRYITNRQDSEASITRSVSKKITSPSAMSTQAETTAMTWTSSILTDAKTGFIENTGTDTPIS